MNFDQTYQLSQHYQQDMRRQAAQQQLAKASQTSRPNIVLHTLGRQMVSMGQKLQAMAEVDREQLPVLQPEAR